MVLMLTPPLPGCVALGSSPSLSEPPFLTSSGSGSSHLLQHCQEDPRKSGGWRASRRLRMAPWEVCLSDRAPPPIPF